VGLADAIARSLSLKTVLNQIRGFLLERGIIVRQGVLVELKAKGLDIGASLRHPWRQRTGPMPSISRSRSGVASMTSNPGKAAC
jgi:hypothetical protein